jgi:uncharacterized protein YndB with AHSA1/START domain
MDTFAESVEIDQPPSRVYAFLINDENLSLWHKDVLKVERLNGENGEVGSISKRYFHLNGRKASLVEEITEAIDNQSISAIMRNEHLEISQRNELKATPTNKTKLTMTIEFTPKSLYGWVAHFFKRNRLHSDYHRNLLNLKMAIETIERS